MGELSSFSFAVGTCNLMCPEDELIMRQRNKLIHVLESKNYVNGKHIKDSDLIADPKRVVKCYQRSAAGKELSNCKVLRPPGVLLKTVTYLLSDPVMDNRLPWHVTYDFVCDRLRAVRQDLIIQQPSPELCITILEPIIRFHVYSAYRLFGTPLSEFDPKLNNNHLIDCLKQILNLYDIVNCHSTSRSEMESLYQIINLGCSEALYRCFNLPYQVMSEDLKLAMKLSLAWYNKNYVTICNELKLLSPLLQACLALHLPEIRRYALKVMSVAYSSKNTVYPLNHLAKLLLYSCESELEEECNNFKIDTFNNSINFLKGTFDSSKQAVQRKTKFITEAIDVIDLPQLLLDNLLRHSED